MYIIYLILECSQHLFDMRCSGGLSLLLLFWESIYVLSFVCFIWCTNRIGKMRLLVIWHVVLWAIWRLRNDVSFLFFSCVYCRFLMKHYASPVSLQLFERQQLMQTSMVLLYSLYFVSSCFRLLKMNNEFNVSFAQ